MTWQKALANVVTDPKELFTLLALDEAYLSSAYKAAKLFPLRVTHAFIARMRKGDLQDPLLNQILPIQPELTIKKNFIKEPLAEKFFNPLPGLLHKYKNRVLFIVSGGCAINCRYCFRRNFSYEKNNPGTLGWKKVLNYIEKDPSINEIILSGGDPLAVSDKLLQHLIAEISKINHIKRLRIHTRLPIVLPERITDNFLKIFSQNHMQTIMVIHCNHPNEIDISVSKILKKIHKSNILLLNQAVLLRTINDDSKTLITLSERLFENRVLPYYLHMLDKVTGSAHFEVSLANAKKIMEEIKINLPGFLVPKLIREKAEAKYKIIIA